MSTPDEGSGALAISQADLNWLDMIFSPTLASTHHTSSMMSAAA
jgi:hypothetical protein